MDPIALIIFVACVAGALALVYVIPMPHYAKLALYIVIGIAALIWLAKGLRHVDTDLSALPHQPSIYARLD